MPSGLHTEALARLCVRLLVVVSGSCHFIVTWSQICDSLILFL